MSLLPPELLSAIVSYASTQDILTLSHTSKALQRAAEPRLYENVVFNDAESTYFGCHAILVRGAFRAPYVKRIQVFQDPRRAVGRNNLAAAPPQFWMSFQHVLTKTVNLEYLFFHPPTMMNSWLLDHEDFRFQLREAQLRLPWDSHMVSFLQTQQKLLSLATVDAREDGPLYPLPPTALPVLEIFNGPALIVAELLGSPLKRLQMIADEETAPILPTIVADLSKIMKPLRTLSIVRLPEEFVLETFQLISAAVFAPRLRYLGVLPLPTAMREWHHLYRGLMRLTALTAVAVDVTHWEVPPIDHFQRAILLELRTYCPTLQHVVFWISSHRFHWFLRGEQWGMVRQSGQLQAQDTLWRS
ncbi:hypothetical protein BD413DRAFT_279821 [Trametes elegans]|nr:hypothetical protein BD413DRAFT_279821 [Trametes elegans]